MIDLIGKILSSSIKNLFEYQPDIFDFTPYTGETEWNLSHHLANEIHKYIFWLNCDVDVTKRNIENRRPDMIFHKRGINTLNFLVVELKHHGVRSDEDIRKIKEDWMGHDLSYRFGTSINIADRNSYIVNLFSKDTESSFTQDTHYLPLPNTSQKIGIPSHSLVNKIFTMEQNHIQTDISLSIGLLDKEIYRLYAQ